VREAEHPEPIITTVITPKRSASLPIATPPMPKPTIISV